MAGGIHRFRVPKYNPRKAGRSFGESRSLTRRERAFRQQVTFEVKGLEEAIAFYDSIPDRLYQVQATSITKATLHLTRGIRNSVRDTFVQRSGRLRKSWYPHVIAKRTAGPSQLAGGNIVGRVASKHPGAWLLQFGGVVHKQNKWLPIPITEEAKNYRSINFPRQLTYEAGGLIEFSGDLFIKSVRQYNFRDRVKIKPYAYLDKPCEATEQFLFNEGLTNVQIQIQPKKVRVRN